ncbi:MAG: hypothetical protein Q4G45_01610 [Actinomycetia bacterium]|nr:hypothetical protein [Actinomycetes bacterium]
MPVTPAGTTTQVLVRSSTFLRLEGFIMAVKSRRGLVTQAIAQWFYQDGVWRLGNTDVWGPVIKQDGTESTQHLRELTVPAGSSAACHLPVAAPDLVATAQAYRPTWQPRVAATDLARHPGLRSSLPASGAARGARGCGAAAHCGLPTVEVVTKGYMTFEVSGVSVEVRGRKASGRKAEAHWFWDGEGWRVTFVQLAGAYLLTSGKEARRTMSESSFSPEQNDYRVVTPPELLAVVRENPPVWDPAFTGCPDPVVFKD